MIHNIHGGEELMSYFHTEDYVIYGFGGSKNNFSEVVYPGRLATCDACHDGGSQQLPLPDTNSKVNNPRGFINPIGPEAAACLSCHKSSDTAAHAATNTSSTLGEACSACHGPSSEFSVTKAHATPSTPVGRE
jgi:OmcA/MtrC family decaheme c-type cytochrome